jgi:AcrR family transcriptional regulator
VDRQHRGACRREPGSPCRLEASSKAGPPCRIDAAANRLTLPPRGLLHANDGLPKAPVFPTGLTRGPYSATLLTVLDISKRDRKTERRQATKAEILDTAWEIAGEKGLAELTLAEVATRIGMRAPSLYSYFDSKNAIYDAMFGQAWAQCLEAMTAVESTLPSTARAALRHLAHAFFDFAVADLARNQLMNQRTIPGFVPSPESYAPAVEVLERTRGHLSRFGIDSPEKLDLFTALIGGLITSQQANDPGGDRWARLLDEAVDMYADHLDLPDP